MCHTRELSTQIKVIAVFCCNDVKIKLATRWWISLGNALLIDSILYIKVLSLPTHEISQSKASGPLRPPAKLGLTYMIFSTLHSQDISAVKGSNAKAM